MTNLLRRLMRDESGQDIVEYALLAAGISVLAMPIVTAIGPVLQAVYTRLSGQINQLPQ